METFINIFDCIFGCHHRRATFKYSLESMSIERRFRAWDDPGYQNARAQQALL